MQLITLAMTLAAASVAIAQAPPMPPPMPPPGTPSAPPPEVPTSTWTTLETPSGAPAPSPLGGDPNCWYQRQPGGEWVNVCSKSVPAYSQTVVPPPYTTSSASTPTMTYKTHPHVWHQRPYKPRPTTWSTADVPIWW